MKHSPAFILLQWLKEMGFTSGWDCSVGRLDEKGDNTFMVKDTSPIKERREMRSGENVFHYGIQILCATVRQTGHAELLSMCSALEKIHNGELVVEGQPYLICSVVQSTEVISLGSEEGKSREMFSANFLATLKEV